jgi:hypothetical protein
VSRAAVSNPDRRREIKEIGIPPATKALLEPGTRAFRMGGCHILVSRQKVGWHLSVSHPERLPTWEEMRDARYTLVPDQATMVLLLPPKSEYVNVHEFCLQMYEIPSEYIEQHQDRL